MQSISRRSFLKGAAAAASGWVLLPALSTAEDAVDPNRFILMADTHVCADRTVSEHGCNPADTFEQAVKDILTFTPRPAGVIVAGDCVYIHGEEGDYLVLKELLNPLRAAGIPILLALGNHDNREALQVVMPDAVILGDAAVPDRKMAVISSPHADWYLLDSLEKTNFTPGRFGDEQLAWLAKSLDESPAKAAVLIAHHYPKKTEEDKGLMDTKAFRAVIDPRTQVKAYFFGHSHAWSVRPDETGLHFVNLPANAWLFDEAKPRGFVDAHLDASGMTLHLHCLDQTDSRHGEEHRLDWRVG
jgi:Icc-related predicted phosphoesterase